MYKCAEQFFDSQTAVIPGNIPFQETDLFAYLKLMYGEEPVINQENGIIKIKYLEDGQYLLTENIFYDRSYEHDAFITLPSIQLKSSDIKFSEIGFELSTKGYCIIDVPDYYKDNVLSRFNIMPYKKTPESEGYGEPYATYKFHEYIWDTDLSFEDDEHKIVYYGILNLMLELIKFSEPLRALNAFDLNLLQWRKGRSMEAHNGIDYKSFVNLITYNTESCSKSRNISVGQFDWYDVTFEALAMGNYENLMNIQKGKQLFDSIKVDTSKAVLVNAFNPKFYHQVGEMTGEGDLYVCTSNMSFREVLDKFEFKW